MGRVKIHVPPRALDERSPERNERRMPAQVEAQAIQNARVNLTEALHALKTSRRK